MESIYIGTRAVHPTEVTPKIYMEFRFSGRSCLYRRREGNDSTAWMRVSKEKGNLLRNTALRMNEKLSNRGGMFV